MMDTATALAVNATAENIDRALKVLVEARRSLIGLGVRDDDTMRDVMSELNDAITATSTAFTSAHMAAFVALQDSRA